MWGYDGSKREQTLWEIYSILYCKEGMKIKIYWKA